MLKIFLLGLVCLSTAQDLSVDTRWRKFTNSRPKTERIKIAQDAINTIVPHLNPATGEFNGIGYWQSGNVYSAMALQDQITGKTTNKAHVVNNLNLVFKLRKNYDQFGYNDDALWWATSAYYAYKAYGDKNLLNHAIATWNAVTTSALTEAQAKSGKSPVKNFAIAGSCDGISMAGGVFWRPGADQKGMNSITTGLYFTLSAYLAEATKETKYKNAAIRSAKWIKAHMISPNNVVLDSLNGASCARSASSWIFTYNSGKVIEGLSVLHDITKDAQMLKIISASVKNKSWQGTNGIVTEGASISKNNDGVGFKAVYIRGLLQAFRRRPNNKNLRTLLHSYIDVQYNALLDLAKKGNNYSAKWVGRAPTSYNSWGQLAALDVLVAGVAVN